MNVHKHARMTVHGRVLLVRRIEAEAWRVADAADAAGVSVRTAYKWLARFRVGGEAALLDRTSAPSWWPRALPDATVAQIEALRRERLSGPAIARRLGLARSSVGAVLEPRLPAIRYERDAPGELIHVDIKKLGRIDGIGHRITKDRRGQSGKRGTGWEFLHVAVDDACRLAYTEILPDRFSR